MAAGDGLVPDWRDAEAYAPLLEVDRSLFAWEWLRRNPDYRAAAQCALEGRAAAAKDPVSPDRWGLHAFEAPHLTAPYARPVWRADVYPQVLSVHAVPAQGDQFDLERFRSLCTLVTAPDAREHLLLSNGLRTIRIDVQAGTLQKGAVLLHYALAGFAAIDGQLLALRRLLALWRTGRFSPALHRSQARAHRFVLMLRAHDSLSAGATQREIAAELLGREANEDRWRVRAPTLRSRVQRLVRCARSMAAAGHAPLLSLE